jgi:Flp pilus assembly protein TadG
MRLPALSRLAACDSGAAIIELAFGLTAFLILILGTMNLAIMLWTIGSLHYAAETAARCASVDPTDCGSATNVQSYALNHYYGAPLSGSNPFTYAANGCGHTVTASYNYTLRVPLAGNYPITLSTAACYP